MPRKTSSMRHQKIYRMRGCSKRTRKNHLGGSGDTTLAYTGQPVHTIPNPFLAYTGKGGSGDVTLAFTGKPTETVPNPFLAYSGKGGSSSLLSKSDGLPSNINAANPVLPNTGPIPRGDIFLNPINPQHGGSCGCGLPLISGGKGSWSKKGGCGPMCAVPLMLGGGKHRKGCKCSTCKSKHGGMKGGNPGIPYPNGLVGTPWTPNSNSWPGVNGIPGDSNYIPNNTYLNDVSRQMIDVGANPPFTGGKRKSTKRTQKGGTLSNFMGQDLINLGRQFQYGIGSAYNALAGYSAPVNPLPWKDQLPPKTAISPSLLPLKI